MTKSPGTAAAPPLDAETQLAAFIAKFDAKDQHLIRAVRAALRRRFPTAHELVYDNYNFFVIGYSPTLRPSDAIVSMAARATSVGLCFIHGAKLPDPSRRLQGSGNQTRFIRLTSADTLDEPDVEELIQAAIAQSNASLAASGHGELIIRSISEKQRPRTKPAAAKPAQKAAKAAKKNTTKPPRPGRNKPK
jgi:hypothetical protein